MPVRDLGRAGAVELDRQLDRRLLRRPVDRAGAAHRTTSCRSRSRNSSFSSGGADGDAQAVGRAAASPSSRGSGCCDRAAPATHACLACERGRNRMKLAPLGKTSTGERVEAPPTMRSRSATICSTRASISSVNCSARRRRSAWRRRGGTAAPPCRARRRATTARRGSRGGCAAIDHVFENVRVTTRGVDSSTRSAPTSRRTAPYASSTTSSPGSAASTARDVGGRLDEPGRVVRRAQERDGRLGFARSRATAASRSSVKSARALALDHGGAGEPGDVAVQLVGRLERGDACDPAPA